MCGLVGVATKTVLSKLEKEIFTELLYMDAVRGWDATGVCYVKQQNKVEVLKRAIPSFPFIITEEYEQLIQQSGKVLIGHNRAATKGEVTDENSHPFTHGDITLAHNGTLHSFADLPDSKKFDVDSEALAYSFSKIAPKTALKKVSGGMALSWYDQKFNTLNLARNEQRPLHFAVNTRGDTVVWASEEYMLRTALSRKKFGKWDYFFISPKTIITFDLDEKWPFQQDSWIRDTFENKQYNTGNYSHKGTGWVGNGYSNRTYVSVEDEKWLKANGFKVDELLRLECTEIDEYPNNMARGSAKFKLAYSKGTLTFKAFGLQLSTMEVGKVYTAKPHYVSRMNSKNGVLVVKDVKKLEKIVAIEEGRKEKKKEGEVLTFVRGPRDNYIPVATFENITKEGCINCGNEITPDDAESIAWVNEGRDACCPSCTSELNEIVKGGMQ